MMHYGAVLMAILAIAPIESTSDWNNPASAQYHIQTDEGPERYFRYQTNSGQYRKEKRLDDGTVVGTYAWIDADGFLRQRDYIADNAGYRILKTKNLYVGRDTPIAQAIKSAKKVPASAGTLVKGTTVAPPTVSVTPYVEINQNSISSTPKPTPAYLPPSSTPAPFSINPWYYSSAPQYDHHKKDPLLTFENGPTYPIDNRGQTYTGNNLGNGYDPQYEYYDGVSVTNDGFRYYIPRAYHEEQNLGDKKSGSFGYIDPFGIRRVIYYNAGPGTGFQHRKNNRYVGFDATPYDPRPY
ncbi:uncharacterized protein LOC123012443 [Tribolium madens]|uniref:uncharacterized protein LOC123012443 n=1 Tax=Tribolium madens TaxID=41895 RepID=UPI001CF734E8|nr:uncharacterized protein LOC123012443 [Tribolium madens]